MARVVFDSNKIFLGTDSAASSRVGQILLFRVEGSIPHSAPLNVLIRGKGKFLQCIANNPQDRLKNIT